MSYLARGPVAGIDSKANASWRRHHGRLRNDNGPEAPWYE